ncbi:hypothetical protein D9Q98_006615 [Chlorella vulgaris]|uniref:Uncharacterized protein n=1 Tax=Chlorella vulgaris TaxID=3077 RepID=A0A9D4YVI0_CHLVU|nr:hypothetical protein D9Q98_006615 [Chlorella vulgaris]
MKTVLLALLLLAPLALSFDECTTSMTGTVGLIACTGNFGKEVNVNQSWATALAPLADATSVTVELRDVRFNPISAIRALDIILGVGSGAATGTVAVSLVNCSMKGQEFDYVNSVAMAGTTAYSLKLDGSEVSYNSVNMSGAFFAQADFSLALQVVSSTLAHNRLMALGVAGVGGAGKASVALSSGSAVLRNDVALVGSLAVGGAASLDVQLSATNVTGNELSGVAHVAVGGQASAAVTGLDDPTVSASRNSVDGLQVDVVLNQPLVPAVLDIYAGLGFNETGFDLPAALNTVQADACSALGGSNISAAGLPADVTALLARLCVNGSANPAVKLASAAPVVESEFRDGQWGLSSALDGLLGDSSLVQDLVAAIEGDQPLGSVLDDVFSSLLANPDVQGGISQLGSLVSQLGQALDTPISSGRELDLSGTISSIISQISGSASSIAGQGEPGGGGVAGVVGNVSASVAGIVDQILGAVGVGGGSGGGNDASGQDTTIGSTIDSIVGAIGGPNSPLAGQNVTSFVPVLGAILQDPSAVSALPGLLGGLLGGGNGGGGGGLDIAALGPILSAVNSNPDASAALPSVLGLLGGLTGGGGGGGGSDSGDSGGLDLGALGGLLGR